MADQIIRLGQFESKAILELQTYAEGIHEQRMSIAGASIQSSVFVAAMDEGASLLVEYYDDTTGNSYNERNIRGAHDLITAPSTTAQQILVSRLHDKPTIRATVVGGTVTFGVYVTIVLSSATDIDAALQREGDDTTFSSDKGIPIMVYDPLSDKWRAARGAAGVQDVRITGNVAVGEPGDPLFKDYVGETAAEPQTLISYSVPVGRRLNLLQVAVTCAFETYFTIHAGGTIIGSAATTAANAHVNFAYRIARTLESGTLVEVIASTRGGAPVVPLECFLQGTLSGV